jgi:hypothetical protein
VLPTTDRTLSNNGSFSKHLTELGRPLGAESGGSGEGVLNPKEQTTDGDLVIANGRVLHAAWPNQSNQRRTLVLAWWRVFPFPSVPRWWQGPLPAELQADPHAVYERTRRPGRHLPGG